MPSVSKRCEARQYDGTNGTFLCGTFCVAITLISDNGTTLVWEDGDTNPHSMSVGDYLVRQSTVNDPFPVVETPTSYVENWLEIPAVPVLALAAGYALTPTILASASANVAVDLDTTLSGTGYQAKAVLAGTSALLSALVITAVTITDNNTVTVTVQNTGLVSLAGATVIVTAGELV